MTQVWYLIRTQPGRELKAAAALRERRYSPYVPVVTRLKRTVKGRRRVEKALIPGMMFVPIDPDTPIIHRALNAEFVTGVLRLVSGDPAPIDPSFVNSLRASQAAGEFDFTPKRKAFAPGQDVRILAGPFTGQIGAILSAPEDDRARVMLRGLFAGPKGVPIDQRHLEAA